MSKMEVIKKKINEKIQKNKEKEQYTKIVNIDFNTLGKREFWRKIYEISRRNCVVLITLENDISFVVKNIGRFCDICENDGVFINPTKLEDLYNWCEKKKEIIEEGHAINLNEKGIGVISALNDTLEIDLNDDKAIDLLEHEHSKEEMSRSGSIYREFKQKDCLKQVI